MPCQYDVCEINRDGEYLNDGDKHRDMLQVSDYYWPVDITEEVRVEEHRFTRFR